MPKKNIIFHMTKEEATLAKMPKFNGYACGHRPHGDKKYNRAKEKRKWQQENGASGPVLFI